jgi:cyanophycinase
MNRLCCFFLVCFTGLAAAGQIPPPAAKEPAGEVVGTLFVVGGGTLPASARAEFVKLAGGPKAKLVVIPTASATADGDGASSIAPWKSYKMESVTLLHTRDRKKADDPAFVKPLTEATAVWFGGGDQSNVTKAYLGTAVHTAIKDLLARGGLVGGTSAGAAIMSEVMITGGNPKATTGKGLGFYHHAVFDQHFIKRDRENRLIGVLAKNPGLFGVGIDEGTVALLQGRTLTVLGVSSIITILSEGAGKPLTKETLKAGQKVDLIDLHKAAVERTQKANAQQGQLRKGGLRDASN